MTSRQYTKKI